MPALSDDEVMRRVQSKVAQCPTPVIKLEMIDTVVDFYEFTLINQIDLPPIDTIVNQPTYAPVFPVGSQFVQAMSGRLNNLPIEQKSADDLDLQWPEISRSYSFTYRHGFSFGGVDNESWRVAVSTQPRFFHFEPDLKVRLVGIPIAVYAGATLGLLLRVAMKPIARLLTSIDDVIWDDNYQTLVAGCLERLMRQDNKPWSNDRKADYWGAQYEAGRTEERDRVLRGNTRNDRQILRSTCIS